MLYHVLTLYVPNPYPILVYSVHIMLHAITYSTLIKIILNQCNRYGVRMNDVK